MAFNEALMTKFKNLDFPDFPSKFQLMNRKETRREKFDYLLQLIIHYANEYSELKDKLLGILYMFLVAQAKTVKKGDSDGETPEKVKNQTTKRQKLKSLFTLKKKDKTPVKRRGSHDHLSTSNNELTEDIYAQLFGGKDKNGAGLDSTFVLDNRRCSDVAALQRVNDILKTPTKSQNNPHVEERIETGSIDDNSPEFKQDQPFNVIGKEHSENFGYVYARFPEHNWKRFYLKCDGPILYFYKSVKDNDYKFWYTIYKCNLEKMKEEVPEHNEPVDTFVISQKYDTRCLRLAIPDHQNRIDDYFNNLQERSRKAPEKMMKFDETIRYPQGVLYLHLDKILGIDLPDNTFIRMTFEPYKLDSKTLSKGKHGDEFHQKFYLPIHNHFNELIMEIMFAENEGWFREKKKELLIAKITLPIPHLHELITTEGRNSVKLPFKVGNKKLFTDIVKGKYKKHTEKQQAESSSKEEKQKEQQALEEKFKEPNYLQIDIYNYTSIQSLYAFHQNRNRTENRVMDESYGLKKYQEVIWRLKLCSIAFDKFKNAQRFIFYHNYPKFSLFCEIFMVLFVYFFKSEHILSYGLLALMLVLIYNYGTASDQIDSFFFSKENRNKMLLDSDIKTQLYVDEKITKTRLKEEKGKVEEASNLFNIKRRGILGRYNQFKQKSAKTLDKLEYFVDMFEKFKNLLLWKDELMTKYFFIVILVLYLFFTFLPVRYITILYLIRRFHKGKSYYKRRKISNKECATIELTKFLRGLGYDINEIKEWPKKVKNFDSKLLDHFQTNLKIYLPAKITEVYKTPEDLTEYVSDADAILRLVENDENDYYLEKDTEKKIMRVRKPAYKYLLNFLMNYVPSDFYTDTVLNKDEEDEDMAAMKTQNTGSFKE